LRENDGRLTEIKGAADPTDEHVEDLVRGKVSHHVVKDVHDVPAAFQFLLQSFDFDLRPLELSPQITRIRLSPGLDRIHAG
jgi:hypothetical protein